MRRRLWDEGEFIQLLNERLRARGLGAGARFEAVPRSRGGVDVSGFRWTGAEFSEAMFLAVDDGGRSDFAPLYDIGADHLRAPASCDGSYKASDGRSYAWTARYEGGEAPRWRARAESPSGKSVAFSGFMERCPLSSRELCEAVSAMVEALIESRLAWVMEPEA